MSWLQPYNEKWLARTGYELPWGWFGRVVVELRRDGRNDRQIWQHFQEFIAHCPAEHVNPGSFYKTFDRWSPAVRIGKELDRQQRARESKARARVDGGPGRPDPMLALHRHDPRGKAAGRAGEKRRQPSKRRGRTRVDDRHVD